MWDDFWNWLPSAAYAYGHGSLVWPDLPASFSIFPGHPQGVPLMIAAASFIAGRFLEAAGPITNVALLAGSSALFAEALAAALVRHGRLQATETPPILVASAVALTTLLNPGLDGAVALSSTPTAERWSQSALLAFSGSKYWRVCRLATLRKCRD